MPQNLIFDFDGTLADTFESALELLNELAERRGFAAVSREKALAMKELSAQEIVRQSGIPAKEIPGTILEYRKMAQRRVALLPPVPGMADTLRALHARGARLGVVSSNGRDNILAFLRNNGLDRLFLFVHSELSLFGKHRRLLAALRQHRLEAAQTLYIGDETRDIEAARKAGLPVACVAWGFNSPELLRAHRPDYLLARPAELLDIAFPNPNQPPSAP